MAKVEPDTLQAGDSIAWTRADLVAYPAPTWTLVYHFVSLSQTFDVTAVDDGGAHKVAVAPDDSRKWNPGVYKWQARVTSAGGEAVTVDRGAVTVLADLAGASAGDYRSHPDKVLAAIEAVIEKRATRDQSSYTIGARSLSRTPLPDLITLRDKYRVEVAALRKAERLKAGLGSGGRVLTRFGR